MRHILLLRGINVGGKNRLPMADLRSALEELGAREVETWIQSGNAVLEAPARLAKGLPATLREQLRARHGLDIPVVLRSATELERAVEGWPWADADPAHRHVGFLAETPPAKAVAALDPDRSPGDRFAVRGRELYLHLPGGVARTKLTNAWFDRQLGTTSTVRNWKTVERLREMARG